MSTTKIYSDLFKNEGGGEYLRNDILPFPPSEYYLDPNGNDENDGLTPETPKKSYTALRNYLLRMKFLSYAGYIYFASGTYDDILQDIPTFLHTYIQGPSEGQAIVNGMTFNYATNVHIGGRFKFINKDLQVTRGCVLELRNGLNIEFNNCSLNYPIFVSMGGVIHNGASSTNTISFTGTNTVAGSTVGVISGSCWSNLGTLNFSGSVTGKRYQCNACGVMIGMNSATKIPGTVAGTADSTSYYG